MERFEPDGAVTVVAGWSPRGDRELAVGSGPIAQEARAPRIRASVSCPIMMNGRLWGVIVASSMTEAAFPANTEEQIAGFTHLVATAIANAESRGELIASRARVVAAADEARRLVVRDLHDGAQQRLIHTVVTLKLAHRAQQEDEGKTEALIAEALEHAERANAELRELAHGIHPSVLTKGGLRVGVDALVSRIAVPVTVDVSVGRVAPTIEACAYFVVAEALTNVAKHAGAERAAVNAWVEDGALRLEVRDDGVGGARPGGTGLVGLADRVAAVGGRLRVMSPPDGGTVVAATVPLP
jgi:signal transduction histidine kinase